MQTSHNTFKKICIRHNEQKNIKPPRENLLFAQPASWHTVNKYDDTLVRLPADWQSKPSSFSIDFNRSSTAPMEGPTMVTCPIFRCFRISAKSLLRQCNCQEWGKCHVCVCVCKREEWKRKSTYCKQNLTWLIIPMNTSPWNTQCPFNQLMS